ncbi:MAG: arginase [Marinilabiliales bacterium]|nr:MAG: arginase [Marinilabiliales bacterium]
MKEIFDFFNPVDTEFVNQFQSEEKLQFVQQAGIYTEQKIPENINDVKIAFFDIDSRGKLGDPVRKFLYKLYLPNENIGILDMGNLKDGNTPADKLAALKEVFIILLEKQVVPVCLSPDSGFLYHIYKVFECLETPLSVVSVNSTIELDKELNDATDETPFLSRIIMDRSKFLFNYTNLGFQSYLVSQNDTRLLDRLLFDAIRLGQVNANPKEVEPVMRDADIVYMSINSIRQSEAPARLQASANGLYGDQACMISRYAGISDKVQLFVLDGFDPDFDINFHTANLLSEIIWYFIEGYSQRRNDYPYAKLSDYKKFVVQVSDASDPIVFYKSNKSDRWWMRVESRSGEKKRNLIVACSYEDYQKACNQEIPNKWLKMYQKIS